MNLVKDIMDQFSGDFIGKLGSLLNADEDSVSQATSTAVPALLAGLSSLTSSGEGARRVTDVLSGIGSSGMNDVDSMLRGDADAMESRGTDLLSTLFGGNMLANLGGALGKSSGLTGGVMRKLLAFLAPIVLGKVAAAWNNKGGTVQALTNLMSEQRSHINEALPASFSLANIPGWSTAKAAPATMANSGRRVSESVPAAPRSAASWAIPLLLGALGVFLLWNFMKPRADETAQVDRDIAAPQEVTVQKPVVDEATPAMDATQISDDLRRLGKRSP